MSKDEKIYWLLTAITSVAGVVSTIGWLCLM